MADEFDRINGFDYAAANDDYIDDEQLDRVLEEIDDIKRAIRTLPDGERLLSGETQRARRTQEEQTRYGDSELRDAVERLIRTTEEFTRSSREADRRLSDEINVIKNQLYKLSGKEDFASSLAKISGNVKRAEEFIININNAVETLSSAAPSQSGLTDTELLRQIYELKTLIGAPSNATEKRNEGLAELYNLLAKVKYEVKRESATVPDKFTAVDALRRRLEETDETDVAPIVAELNAIIDELVALPLDLANFDDVLSYARSNESFFVAPSRKESVRSYLTSVSALMSGGVSNGIDDLPDLIAAKNGIQSNRNEFKCESVYSAVLNTNIALLSEKDESRVKSLRAELSEQVRKLTVLEVCDLVDYPRVELKRGYRPTRTGGADGLFDRLGEIKNLLLDASLAPSENVGASGEEGAAKVDAEGVSRAIMDLKGDCLAILDRLGDRENPSAVEGDVALTLSEAVVQLDRLFDDVKNLVTDSENTVMGSLEVIGDAVASLAATTEERAQASKDDRIKILDGVSRLLTQSGAAPVAGVATNGDVDEIATLNARLLDVEKRQRAILNAIEANALASERRAKENRDEIIAAFEAKTSEMAKGFDGRIVSVLQAIEHAIGAPATNAERGGEAETLGEIKKLREQIFAISMANVSSDERASYQSYNSVILNELYDLADSVADLRDELEAGKTAATDEGLAESLAGLEKKLDEAIESSAGSDAVMTELLKLKDEMAKTPARPAAVKTERVTKTTLPRKSAPAVKRKSKAKPISGSLSIDEILTRMQETELIGDDE